MRLELCGPRRTWETSKASWEVFLGKAVDRGWEPEEMRLLKEPPRASEECDGCDPGNPHESGSSWHRKYLSNDQQAVSDRDAAAMADALERSLADVPELTAADVDWYLERRAEARFPAGSTDSSIEDVGSPHRSSFYSVGGLCVKVRSQEPLPPEVQAELEQIETALDDFCPHVAETEYQALEARRLEILYAYRPLDAFRVELAHLSVESWMENHTLQLASGGDSGHTWSCEAAKQRAIASAVAERHQAEVRLLELGARRRSLLEQYDPEESRMRTWLESLSQEEARALDTRAFIGFLREGGFAIG